MAQPPEACPSGPPLQSYTVRQRFQRGLMFWIEETDTYYILFNLGAHPTDSRLAFERLGPLVLKPGASADNRVGEEPPYGLIEPVRGFGLVWRGEVEGLTIDLRQALGWATEHEVGFQSMFQCQRQESYSQQICYLLNSNGALVVLSSHAIAGNVWWWR
ncbi:MAG: hypothetical protein R3300_05250 [Candidatus Promineifilaceae bacterium]|nr:hypothetical protein [Candidatus Promineifilaceae bacterium]